jgi:acyl-CoA synthetase (AMP-forming)/AMP-acid ligase II
MKEYQKIKRGLTFKYSSVYTLLFEKYSICPDKEFVFSLLKADQEVYTYGQFIKRVNKARAFLEKSGLKKGDAINLILPNSADFLILYFAALSSGVIVCPINYNLVPREISYIINDSKGLILFTDEEYVKKVEEIIPQIPGIREIIIFSKNEADQKYFNLYSVFDNLECDIIEHDNIDLDDRSVIIYTSGTSGNPKGVTLTHANLLADAQAIAEWFAFDGNTRTLCILPLFHNNGQIVTFLAPLWAGGSTIMIKGNVSLIAFWDLVDKYKANWTSVIPTILSVLLSFKRKRKDNHMKGIICGGALLPQSVQLQFEEIYNVPVFEGYGLTETTSFSCFNPLKISERKIGSIGKELPVNEMSIMDEEGKILPDNSVGEICIRGFNVFLEYCNLPEKDKIAFRGGWFHSGDYGSRDENGFYYISGRKDDLIIKGGENLYPREIENVVYMHPGVKDCAAIGIDHPIWGQDVVIFIETKENALISEGEIRKFCEDKIAVFKIPSRVYFINELDGLSEIPKGPTKKILRKELEKFYRENLSVLL